MAAPRFDVLAIGNAIVDVIAHADETFLERWGMTKGTMALVDDERAHTLYAAMGPAVEISGGSAANTAAGLAGLGASVAFIGKVADDQLGEVFAHDIRAAGVHFDARPIGGGPATARCLVLVTPDAQRTLNTYLGASSLIGPEDVDVTLATSCAVVYCEGYLWDLPPAKEAMRRAMELASSAGGKVAFTLSDPFCVDRHREEFLALVDGPVDVLFANEVEIMSLTGSDSFEAAVEAVAGRVELACLTRSEHGSVVVASDGARVAVPAASVDAVVDTTGAGDLYASGFLRGYTSGLDPEQCARLGSLAAAEVISHVGARPEADLAARARDAGLLTR